MIRPTSVLFSPPLGALQTPSAPIPSLSQTPSAADGGAVPPVTGLRAFGIPAVVKREGGSTVRIESTRVDEWREQQETAIAASATASSSAEGSNMMVSSTVATSKVTGGKSCGVEEEGEVVEFGEGYMGMAAAQSSSKSGSSSPSDMRRGSCAVRRARFVVRDRRGRGKEVGGDRRRICECHI